MDNGVPVIDIAPLRGARGPRGFTETVDSIGTGCREWGFFQVVNHGVSDRLIKRVWSETHRFFALPRETKLAISRTKENPRGYYDRELTKNRRDLKEVFDFGGVPHPELPDDHPKNKAAVDGYNQWPATLPSFKQTMVRYYDASEELGLKLLEALCVGLGAERDTLRPHFTPVHSCFMRLNYYPLDDPLEQEDAAGTTQLGDMALHHQEP